MLRTLGALVILAISVFFVRLSAGEAGLQLWGLGARALVTSVSRNVFGVFRSSYTAHYEFTTADGVRSTGSCPSYSRAEGATVKIRYFRRHPDWNFPAMRWYAAFRMLEFGAVAWLFAAWSSRLFLSAGGRKPEISSGAAKKGGADQTAADAAPRAPAASDAPGEEPFRTTWIAALLLSIALGAAALVLNLAWIKIAEA